MKQSIFDIGFCKYAGVRAQLPNVLKYALENRNSILSPDETTELANSIRSILKTPISEFFNRMIQMDLLRNFAPLYIPKGTNIPEILATPMITIDIRQADTKNFLDSIPLLRNKILVNVSSTIKTNHDEKSISAVDVFQQYFVRGHLVASYNDTDGWLNPYLAEYVMKTYSMTISGLISRYYNLSLSETLKVAGYFCLYFTHMLSKEKDNLYRPPLFYRCTFLGSNLELEELLDSCHDVIANSDGGLSINQVCNDILTVNINEKMKNFNTAVFLSLCGNLGPDLITSRIALEYPPYWVYMLLLAFSGAKIPLIYQLNSHRLAQDGKTKFLNVLANSNEVFEIRR